MRFVWVPLLVLSLLPACSGPESSPRSPTAPDTVRAQCAAPAPYLQAGRPTQSYVISFHTGVEARTETARLEGKYGFRATSIEANPPQFTAAVPQLTMQLIRCEPTVDHMADMAALRR